MPFRKLSRTVYEELVVGVPVPPTEAQLFDAETKRMLQQWVLEDRRTLSSVGQRFVFNVVRRRMALERVLEDPAQRLRCRGRKANRRRPK
jgi:hypothetical protein